MYTTKQTILDLKISNFEGKDFTECVSPVLIEFSRKLRYFAIR